MNFLNLPKAQHDATPSWEKRSSAVAIPQLKETEPAKVKPMNKGGRPRVADKLKEMKKEHDEEIMAFIESEPTKKDVYEYFCRKVQEINDS